MLVGNFIDTLLNLSTFVFIGFVVWIVIRPSKDTPPHP